MYIQSPENPINKGFFKISLTFFKIKNLDISKILCTFASQLRENLIEGKSDILKYSLRHTHRGTP